MKEQNLRRALSATAFCGLLSITAFSATPTSYATANDEFQLSKDIVSFDGNSGTQQVQILKGKNYVLFSASDWMTCTQKDGTLQISVQPHKSFLPRTASVILTSKKTNYSKVLTVKQRNNNKPDIIKRTQGSNLLFLTDMDLSKSKPFFFPAITKNITVENRAINMKGTHYEDGIGTHSPTVLAFRINGATHFNGDIAIDDEIILRNAPAESGSATYSIFVDNKQVQSGEIKTMDPDAAKLDINLTGGKYFIIRLESGASTDCDHIDIGNGFFTVAGEKPVMVTEEEIKADAAAQAKTVEKTCCQQCKDKKDCPKKKARMAAKNKKAKKGVRAKHRRR